MLCIPRIADYPEIFTNEGVKDFVFKKFGECFKCTREELYSKLDKEKTLEGLLSCFILFLEYLMKYKNMLN